MKKIRLVILSLVTFSLFSTAFFYLFFLIYANKYNYNNDFFKRLEITISSNIITTLIMFLIVLLWYLYHIKDRKESYTSGILLVIFIIYLALFINGYFKIDKNNFIGSDGFIFKSFSFIIYYVSGIWLIVSLIPIALHLIASICTGGFDNVGEPDNIYGFIFTILGLCFIITLIAIALVDTYYGDTLVSNVYSIEENGLVYSLIVLTFILCAGLRFNHIILNIINTVMNFTFVIWWICIMFSYKNDVLVCSYLALYNLIVLIPMFVLSIFIFKHYIQVDRFYKSRTKLYYKD